MKKIFSGVVGVLALAYTGYAIYDRFDPSLPNCGSSDTRSSIKQVWTDDSSSVTKITNETELSYNKDSEVRHCSAYLNLSDGTEGTVKYKLYWQNKKSRMFMLEPEEE